MFEVHLILQVLSQTISVVDMNIISIYRLMVPSWIQCESFVFLSFVPEERWTPQI